jgi:hypothetical protein
MFRNIKRLFRPETRPSSGFKVVQRFLAVVVIVTWSLIVLASSASYLWLGVDITPILQSNLILLPVTIILSLYFGGGVAESIGRMRGKGVLDSEEYDED